ncbi:MAG: hypothetical protein GY865_15265 [candidate division Zixibacteria bacterium]|nr:hypothetical protein [candidate division Zixibacteria bacterium]
MGRCKGNIIDEQSAIYNPGALGIFHLDKVFFISAPAESEFAPNREIDQQISTFSIGGGISYKKIKPSQRNGKLNLSISLAYSEIKLDWNKWYVVSIPSGETFSGTEFLKYKMYSVNLGIDYYLKAGIGWSYKKVSDVAMGVRSRDEVYDYGWMIEFPITDLLRDNSYSNEGISFDLTPSLSYIRINDGGVIPDSIWPDPPPLKSSRAFSYSIAVAIELNHTQLISLKAILEGRRRGFEIGAGRFFYFRWGFIDMIDSPMYQKTSGYGIYLGGLLKWLKHFGICPKDATQKYLFEHLDFSYEYARFHDDGDWLRGNMKIIRFNLSF